MQQVNWSPRCRGHCKLHTTTKTSKLERRFLLRKHPSLYFLFVSFIVFFCIFYLSCIFQSISPYAEARDSRPSPIPLAIFFSSCRGGTGVQSLNNAASIYYYWLIYSVFWYFVLYINIIYICALFCIHIYCHFFCVISSRASSSIGISDLKLEGGA